MMYTNKWLNIAKNKQKHPGVQDSIISSFQLLCFDNFEFDKAFRCKVHTCFSSRPLPPARRWKTGPAQPGSDSWWRPQSSQHQGALQSPQADGLGSPTCTNYPLLFVHCLATEATWVGSLPSARRFRCTSAGCFGTGRVRGRGQSQNDHTQWWEAAGQWV